MKYLRPTIEVEIFEIFKKDKEIAWNIFKKHHYLTSNLNKAARCFVAKWQNKIIGFNSVIPFPHGSLRKAWREHRLVVLSDFQGLGVGIAMSEAIGEMLLLEDKRYFSRTANKKLGLHRNNSPRWRPTSNNQKNEQRKIDRYASKQEELPSLYKQRLLERTCYSHEYIGNKK